MVVGARGGQASPASSMSAIVFRIWATVPSRVSLHQLEDVALRVLAVDEPRRVGPAADVVDVEPPLAARGLDPGERLRHVVDGDAEVHERRRRSGCSAGRRPRGSTNSKSSIAPASNVT